MGVFDSQQALFPGHALYDGVPDLLEGSFPAKKPFVCLYGMAHSLYVLMIVYILYHRHVCILRRKFCCLHATTPQKTKNHISLRHPSNNPPPFNELTFF